MDNTSTQKPDCQAPPRRLQRLVRYVDVGLAAVFYLIATLLLSTKSGVVAGWKAFAEDFSYEMSGFKQFCYDIYLHPNCKKLPKK